MNEILTLSYECTPKDQEEAKNHLLRKSLGGGSKWLTWIILSGVLLLMLLRGWQMLNEVAPGNRLYAALGFVALCTVIYFIAQRLQKQRPASNVELQISTDGIGFRNGGQQSFSPWSAFSECVEIENLYLLFDQPRAQAIIIPKRVFPDDHSREWFRSLTTHSVGANQPESDKSEAGKSALLPQAPNEVSTDRDVLRVRYELGFRDSVNHTLATWQTWALVGGFVGLTCIVGMVVFLQEPSGRLDILLLSLLSFVVFAAIFLIPLLVIQNWRMQKKYFGPIEASFSDKTVVFSSPANSTTADWSMFQYFKETRRSYILWRNQLSLLVPKRAFESLADHEQFRTFLNKHLQPSRWYFG